MMTQPPRCHHVIVYYFIISPYQHCEMKKLGILARPIQKPPIIHINTIECMVENHWFQINSFQDHAITVYSYLLLSYR